MDVYCYKHVSDRRKHLFGSDTFIPLTLPDPNSLNVNSLSCLVTKKRRGGQREAQTKRDELSGKSLLFRFSFLSFLFFTRVTWLILPVVICLSQRLSHACLSINNFVLWNCEWLIKSVIVYLIIPYYLDNRGNSRANTCIKTRLLEGLYLLDKKPTWATSSLVIHNNYSNRMA